MLLQAGTVQAKDHQIYANALNGRVVCNNVGKYKVRKVVELDGQFKTEMLTGAFHLKEINPAVDLLGVRRSWEER